MRPSTVLLGAVATLILLAACRETREAKPKPADVPQARTLATVNGTPITEADLAQLPKRGAAGMVPGHEAAADAPQILQTLVRDELILQQAVELGLDQDPEYRLRVEALQAQVRAFQRREMAARHRKHVRDQAQVKDQEASAYFEKHATFIRSRVHVWQIHSRGRPDEMLRDLQDLRAGMPFEKVAARRFPVLPAQVKAPWDLGELHWSQVPPAWVGVVDRLEPGQTSEVIQGGSDRSWIIRVVGRTVDPAVSFETEKERIVERLRQGAADALYDRKLAELKERASIVYPSAR